MNGIVTNAIKNIKVDKKMSEEINLREGIIIKSSNGTHAILITDGKKNVKLTVTLLQLMLERSDNGWTVNDKLLHFLIGE